jgi:hypothetical protein
MSQIDHLLKWRQEHPEEYRAKKIAGLKGSPKCVAAAKMVSKKYVKERLLSRSKNPRSIKGTEHALALIWRFRDARGRHYEFKNLAHFIRNNEQLFEPYQTIWTKMGRGVCCTAYHGLASLRPVHRNGKLRKKVAGSWFGWTWISAVEDEKGGDLLDRGRGQAKPQTI